MKNRGLEVMCNAAVAKAQWFSPKLNISVVAFRQTQGVRVHLLPMTLSLGREQ